MRGTREKSQREIRGPEYSSTTFLPNLPLNISLSPVVQVRSVQVSPVQSNPRYHALEYSILLLQAIRYTVSPAIFYRNLDPLPPNPTFRLAPLLSVARAYRS